MNCGCNCNCNCNKHGEQTVKVKLKLHGAKWEDSLSYSSADAAQRHVGQLFKKKLIDIANGNIIAVETEQNGIKKHFIVERRDITTFDVKEI